MPHSRVRCFGGHVIYFSGDAINCWFECDDGLHVTACAMQRAMDHLGEVVTPAGSRVRLTMKVAIAVGSARRFVVGDTTFLDQTAIWSVSESELVEQLDQAGFAVDSVERDGAIVRCLATLRP